MRTGPAGRAATSTGSHGRPGWADDAVRPYLVAFAYLLGGFTAFHQLGTFNRLTLARRVFGRDGVDGEIGRIRTVLDGWGYRPAATPTAAPDGPCQALLLNRSPRLEDLTTGVFARLRRLRPPGRRAATPSRDAAGRCSLGYCDPPVRTGWHPRPGIGGPSRVGRLGRAWHATSTLTPRSAATSAPSWPRQAGGWPPRNPRSPSRRSGPGRPARPGSRRWTGCR